MNPLHGWACLVCQEEARRQRAETRQKSRQNSGLSQKGHGDLTTILLVAILVLVLFVLLIGPRPTWH